MCLYISGPTVAVHVHVIIFSIFVLTWLCYFRHTLIAYLRLDLNLSEFRSVATARPLDNLAGRLLAPLSVAFRSHSLRFVLSHLFMLD